MMDAAILDRPVADLTVRQLMEVMASCDKPAVTARDGWHVNSLKELSRAVGVSYTTLWRMKRDGLLDSAVSQYGRWVRIDVERVLDILRLSNRKKNRTK